MRRALLLFCSLALLAGACSSGGKQPAATVNGIEISQQQVVDELEAISTNTDYTTQIESSSNGATKVHGTTEGSFDPTFVSLVLSRQIAFQLIEAEVKKRALTIPDAVRQAALDDLYSQMGQGSQDAGKVVFEKFPKTYQDQLATWNAEVNVLQGDIAGVPPVTPASEQDYYDAHPDDFVQVCASHILVDTADKATALKAQLDAGADFAQLATDNSSDTASAANGGDLGCVGKGTYVAEFETAVFGAPIGEVVGPVQTQFGFHLIKVASRSTPPFEQVQAQVAKALSDLVSTPFSDYFKTAVQAAKITVDSKYGTWNPTSGQVDPPASAATPATSTTATSTP